MSSHTGAGGGGSSLGSRNSTSQVRRSMTMFPFWTIGCGWVGRARRHTRLAPFGCRTKRPRNSSDLCVVEENPRNPPHSRAAHLTRACATCGESCGLSVGRGSPTAGHQDDDDCRGGRIPRRGSAAQARDGEADAGTLDRPMPCGRRPSTTPPPGGGESRRRQCPHRSLRWVASGTLDDVRLSPPRGDLRSLGLGRDVSRQTLMTRPSRFPPEVAERQRKPLFNSQLSPRNHLQ
jgi:hypothetical protein